MTDLEVILALVVMGFTESRYPISQQPTEEALNKRWFAHPDLDSRVIYNPAYANAWWYLRNRYQPNRVLVLITKQLGNLPNDL